MRRRWKATWVEAGKWREFVFDSIDDLKIARIDGRLLALACGIRLPDRFALDEIERKEQKRWALANE